MGRFAFGVLECPDAAAPYFMANFCICGHHKPAHHPSKDHCRVRGCLCKKYKDQEDKEHDWMRQSKDNEN